jgi:hypothetical protein
MPGFGALQKFFGKTVSDAAGYAAGGAVAATLEPELREITNEAWSKFQTLPLDVGDVADIVAEDVQLEPWGADQAAKSGISHDNFDALLGAKLNAPGIGELFQMWRRGLVNDADFVHGLRKAKLEGRWDAGLKGLHDVLLSSEELGAMQQQGFVDEARANSEGGLQGVTPERQQLRFEASGLPPGIGEALEMLRRSIIDDSTFGQIVREGHTKTKYTDVLLQLRDRVLSAPSYATLRLKGWITPEESYTGGALTGYTPEQMDLMYKEHGRPATTHQVFIGNRRGGKVGGPTADIDQDFMDAVIRSDIRPEYAPVLWAARYTYPAAFVLRALAQGHDITEAQTEQILLYEGWEPTLAKQVAAKWAGAKTSAGKEASATDLLALYDGQKATQAETLAALEALGYPTDEAQAKIDTLDARRVTSARNVATSDLHAAFKKGQLDAAGATKGLTALGITPWAVPLIVAAWQAYLDAFPPAAPAVPPPPPL